MRMHPPGRPEPINRSSINTQQDLAESRGIPSEKASVLATQSLGEVAADPSVSLAAWLEVRGSPT